MAILAILLTSVPAIPLEPPPMSKKEGGSFVVTYKEGGARWRADWTDEKITEDGETGVRIVLKGQGIRYPYDKDTKWESVALWKTGSSFRPVESSSEVRDMKDKLVTTEKTTVDENAGTVSFGKKDYESTETVAKTYEADGDLLIVDGLVLALRSLPFGTNDTVKAQFLTGEPELYNVEFKQKGIEKLDTPMGEIECYKVELVPKLGVLNVFKVFFPKTYFWFTVAPPHRWVRYEGLENGRESPEVIMQAVSYSDSD